MQCNVPSVWLVHTAAQELASQSLAAKKVAVQLWSQIHRTEVDLDLDEVSANAVTVSDSCDHSHPQTAGNLACNTCVDVHRPLTGNLLLLAKCTWSRVSAQRSCLQPMSRATFECQRKCTKATGTSQRAEALASPSSFTVWKRNTRTQKRNIQT